MKYESLWYVVGMYAYQMTGQRQVTPKGVTAHAPALVSSG